MKNKATPIGIITKAKDMNIGSMRNTATQKTNNLINNQGNDWDAISHSMHKVNSNFYFFYFLNVLKCVI